MDSCVVFFFFLKVFLDLTVIFIASAFIMSKHILNHRCECMCGGSLWNGQAQCFLSGQSTQLEKHCQRLIQYGSCGRITPMKGRFYYPLMWL